MRRVNVAVRRSAAPVTVNDDEVKKQRREDPKPGNEPKPGLRERKKARLRQQIVETALHLFRQRGYENTRIDDIVHTLEISQPTFFRYFPTKAPVFPQLGRPSFARQSERLN